MIGGGYNCMKRPPQWKDLSIHVGHSGQYRQVTLYIYPVAILPCLYTYYGRQRIEKDKRHQWCRIFEGQDQPPNVIDSNVALVALSGTL